MSVPSLVAVIDDDEDVRDSLEMFVGSIGHAASLFDSAEALLASGSLDRYACYVTDFQMSGMDGIELAGRLRDLTSSPVILITAFASEEVRHRARAAGVRKTLSKPFDPNVLIAELRSILG